MGGRSLDPEAFGLNRNGTHRTSSNLYQEAGATHFQQPGTWM